MTVLTILGLLGGIVVCLYLVGKINKYTQQRFHYLLFNKETLIIVAIAYALIYSGIRVYQSALSSDGDLLNGQLMVGIGFLFIVVDIWINIKHTSFWTGVFLSPVQLLFYVVAVALIVVLAFMAIAALGGSRNESYSDDEFYY